MITNDNNVTLGKYCANHLAGKAVVVPGDYTVITFHSKSHFRYRGFQIFFTAVQHPRSGKC